MFGTTPAVAGVHRAKGKELGGLCKTELQPEPVADVGDSLTGREAR